MHGTDKPVVMEIDNRINRNVFNRHPHHTHHRHHADNSHTIQYVQQVHYNGDNGLKIHNNRNTSSIEKHHHGNNKNEHDAAEYAGDNKKIENQQQQHHQRHYNIGKLLENQTENDGDKKKCLNIDSYARRKESIAMDEHHENSCHLQWKEYDIATYDRLKSEGVDFSDENGNLPSSNETLPKNQLLKSRLVQQGFFYHPEDFSSTAATTTTETMTSPGLGLLSDRIFMKSANTSHNNATQREPTITEKDFNELDGSIIPSTSSITSTKTINCTLTSREPTKYTLSENNTKKTVRSKHESTRSIASNPRVHNTSIVPCTQYVEVHDTNRRRTSITVNGKLILFSTTALPRSPSPSSSLSPSSSMQVGECYTDNSTMGQSQSVPYTKINTNIVSCQQTAQHDDECSVCPNIKHNVNSKDNNDDDENVKNGQLKESITRINDLSLVEEEKAEQTKRDDVFVVVQVDDDGGHSLVIGEDYSKQSIIICKEQTHQVQRTEDDSLEKTLHISKTNKYNSNNNNNNNNNNNSNHQQKEIEESSKRNPDDPNAIALNPNVNKELSEALNHRLMVPERSQLSRNQKTDRDVIHQEAIALKQPSDSIVKKAEKSNIESTETISDSSSISLPTLSSITTTTIKTSSVDGLSNQNSNRFDYPQEITATEKQFIEPNANTKSKHQRLYSTDEDEFENNNATLKTFHQHHSQYFIRHQNIVASRRNRSLSAGNLLDLIDRRSFFKDTRTGQYFSTEETEHRPFSGEKLWLSRSCSDITTSGYSSEEILSSVESIAATEADDEFEFDTHVKNDKSQEELSGSEEKKLKRRKAIRRGWSREKAEKVTKQQSISIDTYEETLNPDYFSHIHDRRNGIIEQRNGTLETDAQHQDINKHEFVSDLAEFKRLHKEKHKKGLFITRSVESIVKGTKKRKKFLTGIFSLKHHHHRNNNHQGGEHRNNKNSSMENLRETCILDDDDDEVNAINSINGHHHYHTLPNRHGRHARNEPEISLVKDSVKKVSGVIELYIDKHGDVIRKIEIVKVPGQSLGFFIRFGNGIDRMDGIFISRVTLDSFVDKNNLLHTGDEILQINKVNVTEHSLEQVAAIMQTAERIIITTRSALPLPVNASPLLKSSYSNNDIWGSESGKVEDIGEFPHFGTLTNNNGDSKHMTRTWSDPNHKLCDAAETLIDHDVHARERSKSSGQQHAKIQRVSSFQNNVQKSPVFSRKLPPIPDGKIQDFLSDELHSKGFSRAQRYQTTPMQKSPTAELEDAADTTSVQSAQKSPKFLKSPKLFTNKREHKKNSTGSILSIPSNDSLSSMSDSEESNKSMTPEKVRVYSSDSTNYSGPTKGYTGKLNVAIYKLIGRLSNLDAECYCTIEIDDEFKATTQPHKIKEVVGVDESFDIDIQNAHVLMFFIFHKQTSKRQDKLVSQACIVLDNLLKQQYSSKVMLTTTNHVQMRVKINFTEAGSYLHRSPSERSRGVFGFNLSQTLVKEENTIPIIVRKCVQEIEKRGLDLTGIYRISGSARKKKLLRQQFEENSLSTDVSNPDEVDCHVLAGILKDYLRELPNPLISDEMYNNIYNKAMIKNKDQNNLLAELMKKLPYTNRATLIYIMDHLKKVAANSEVNKMTYQNIAVCFGPVMMSTPTGSGNMSDMLDFKKQIDALEFLLSIWPTNVEHQNSI